ncbi:MAG: hypothetical protein QOF62_2085 [Pyrinomonadaceae bacterium]|jgi:hypothetical protein|nr:hypothetical protein [Pyrinomonadaceae bacterium]
MNYRFSGHETFPCRYAWLPKAYRSLTANPRIFGNEEEAIVAMGVGKNMVRAIRFWVQTTGIASALKDGGYSITDFGEALMKQGGFDPFLEDKRTLWLIHWKLSTQVSEPLFAWDYLLNKWRHQEIGRTSALRAFQQEAKRLERKLSTVTLEQHFDTFLHTYVPTRSRKGEILEDNLDCPLVELELIQRVGERDFGGGRREPIYAFRREPKSEITPELFVFCLNEFWTTTRRATEKKITFRDISVGHGSPGQIFKLPEWDLRERLDRIEDDSHGMFSYKESAALQEVTRTDDPSRSDRQCLEAVYQV